MQKAIFIDKDGTLIKDIPFNVDPELINLENNSIKGLKRLQEDGFKLIIISNQAGVAHGYFAEESLLGVHRKIEALLAAADVRLDGFYYCPNHPEGRVEQYRIDCNMRKPAPGMLLKAAADFDIDLNKSWMIGDILHDMEAGKRAGCRTVLIDNGNETEWKWNTFNQPDYKAASINEAADFILDENKDTKSEEWSHCRNILVIRADNMGDLLMSTPAIKALKETFNARITVLTSSMAEGISKLIPEIDETIVFNLPWVKLDSTELADGFNNIIETISERNFDAAVVFSVYSQNPLPAAMLAWLARIPLRLSYCRENPYHLLTHWVPDKEPFSTINHQVRRDLDLVAKIGAYPVNENLSLAISTESEQSALQKLAQSGADMHRPWLIAHAGVSEEKRQYPFSYWVEACKKIIANTGYQIVFTGSSSERKLTDDLQNATGSQSFSLAGELSIEEFAALIKNTPLLISVNTGSVHIAAAFRTPMIVLYALSNPQHFPWLSKGKLFCYSVPKASQSKNEVIRFVNETWFSEHIEQVSPDELAIAASAILSGEVLPIPELPENITKHVQVIDQALQQLN